MSQVLRLPDELYRILADYAARHQETPEEALAALVRALPEEAASTEAVPEEEGTAGEHESYEDPWEGFREKYHATNPDLFERHDYYIGQAALETHDDEDEQP